MLRRVRRSSASLVVAALLWPRVAAADPKLQLVAEGAIGWTDNVSSSPDDPVAGVPEKSAGSFAVLSPGLVLAGGTARFMQRLAFTHSVSLFFTDSGATSLSNRLDYRGLYAVSRRVDLVLGSSLVQTQAHTAGVVSAPGASELSAALSGTGSFLVGTADEYLSYDMAPGWRGYQGVGVLGATPLFGAEAPRTGEVGGRLGLEHHYRAESFGLELGARYTVLEDGALADGTRVGVQRQLVGTGLGRWRHDFGYFFTGSAEAGAMRVQRLNAGRGFWHPVGGASLAYATETGDAELSYAHHVTTAPAVGQSFLADEVRLRGGLPLMDKGELLLALSAGYVNGRLIEPDMTLATRLQTILADVALGWQATDQLLLGPRYTHARQISDVDAPPLPLSFVRHTVILGASFKVPPDREMPRVYRAPRRVDGTDEIRDGSDSAVERGSSPRAR